MNKSHNTPTDTQQQHDTDASWDDSSAPTTHYPFSCGVEYNHVSDLPSLVADTTLDFLVIPIAHPRYVRYHEMQGNQPFTRSDLLLDSSQWKSAIVPKLSTWLDVDSPDQQIRKSSVAAMRQEISWAAHLAVPALLIPPPTRLSPAYAQIINQTLQSLTTMRLWMRIPLVAPEQQIDRVITGNDEADINTWTWWNNFRLLCNHHPSLHPVLEITADLPSQDILDQWLGEPIKCVFVPTSIFIPNKKGYPTLTKKHRDLLGRIFKYNIQFVISGNVDNVADYYNYLYHLHQTQSPITELESFEQPYLDYLQMPLQPLMDNLESQTYEIFERDPVKYLEYKNAIAKALVERTAPDYVSTVMVVGAGRGPLIKAAILASQEAQRTIKVFAVEKNPNAIVTLRNRIVMEQWQDIVTIVECDMRHWQTTERADIMVSELLGSFGDNELSPECLDGAQRFLRTDGGISIPAWYTSYLAPISSSKLYNEVACWNLQKHFEMPYVVKAHNFFQMATSQPLFTFAHPNEELQKQQMKAGPQGANIPVDDSTLHGFIGYFDCCLYGDVHLSINPANFSTGMFSWFPIFFPIREPINVNGNNTITVHFWRNATRAKVWYEWAVTSPSISAIHNPGGRSYWIGL
ncbi:hypothetical protein SAMD00019534_036020 [Acytostelium subglobosum LB1]|uniref:hypothetical protein n=1 Tax=Acytostelium subglobosum LB1 TaxID=1410327 RepID=UPI000644D6BB|nr:hypothetical protein SAMD00019534_036020 [Acytostelium subglobosum LB1]GAM20427.1 hypothetical protein SAMD00019534_036020 [Acytostelium subglobosum LB1]|eukprot:XP_012759948.1 hypothetical protein SAMD00019534_036020 [Acytostelium subglobosum LB1]